MKSKLGFNQVLKQSRCERSELRWSRRDANGPPSVCRANSELEKSPDRERRREPPRTGSSLKWNTHIIKTTNGENSSKPETFRLAHNFSFHSYYFTSRYMDLDELKELRPSSCFACCDFIWICAQSTCFLPSPSIPS
ncbi:hypothetical protein Q5P01_006455 [Channa striata]|uniref:Uncharacterized protein n=1 Tax=Channa striata TaxID=64152 RepID=A0AA88NEC1_CHASR|nr:hypothetical protein Q5P01_006455 [Channa striata]